MVLMALVTTFATGPLVDRIAGAHAVRGGPGPREASAGMVSAAEASRG
jgi:hypothetical protein